MELQQHHLQPGVSHDAVLTALQAFDPDVVLAFGDVAFFDTNATGSLLNALPAHVPRAACMGCSTAGEIVGPQVHQGTLSLTAMRMRHTPVRMVSRELPDLARSDEVGEALARELMALSRDLRHILILAPGVDINGSALVAGLQRGLRPAAPHDERTHPGGPIGVSGGLAGDGGAFLRTWTLGPRGLRDRDVVALGFYGQHLSGASAARGGWEPFGPTRRVTRVEGSVLHTLDHEPALDIYRRYLGEHARDLPASGLLFPLEIVGGEPGDVGLIRTILGIDEAQGALVLAGDVPPGAQVRMMHASTEHLILAAEQAVGGLQGLPPQAGAQLAILVSCVGRRLVMGDRVDEEVEVVAESLGPQAVTTGFYSNGEIAAWRFHGDCRLHNQTMTITRLHEAAQ